MQTFANGTCRSSRCVWGGVGVGQGWSSAVTPPHPVQVSKLKRHLDKVAVMKFWETLDR